MKERIARQDVKDRLPPGQYLTEKWPVLHAGSIPRFDAAQWDFKIWGLVEQPVRLTHAELAALPKTTLRCHIRCVPARSPRGVTFQGDPANAELALGRPTPAAEAVAVQRQRRRGAHT